MAAPIDSERQGNNFTTAVDPWTVTVKPSGNPIAGDLLLIYARTGGTATFNTPSGYTALLLNDSSDACDDNNAFWYRYADGTEGSSSVSVDLSGTSKGAAIGYTITGAADPAQQAPEIFTPVGDGIYGTSANNANPPQFTPTGGSKDYLWLIFAGQDGEATTPVFSHGTYVNDTNADSGTGGAVATNNRIGSASLQKTAATEDPGLWTHAAAATGGTAYTMAIHPPAVGMAQGDQSQPLLMNLSRR